MCYDLFHICKYCNDQYECSLPNYVCPSINHDEDELMCNPCRKREAIAFKEAMARNEVPEDRIITIDDWDYNES